MPIINESELDRSVSVPETVPYTAAIHDTMSMDVPVEQKPTDFVDKVKAAWRLDSILYSYRKDSSHLQYDPDFNPLDAYPKEQWNIVKGSKNKAHAEMKLEQAQLEENDRRVLQDGGGEAFLAHLVASLGDPLTYVPGFGVGKTIIGTAGRVALSNLVTNAASEFILHQTQLTRTKEESAMNIAAGGLLGGALGAGGHAIANLFTTPKLDMPSSPLPDVTVSRTTGSAGAMAVNPRVGTPEYQKLMDDYTMAPGHLRINPEALNSKTSWSPMQSIMQQVFSTDNTFLSARTHLSKLLQLPYVLNKHLRGEASDVPVERLMRTREDQIVGQLDKAYTEAETSILAQVKRGQITIDQIRQELASAGIQMGDKITKTTIKDLYAAAIRNEKSSIPDLVALVERRKKTLVDVLGNEAIDTGVVDRALLKDRMTGAALKDLDKAARDALNVTSATHTFLNNTALGYLSRVYNKEKIRVNPHEFVRRLKNSLLQSNPGLDPDELEAALRKTADVITGDESVVSGADLSRVELPGIPAALKERTLQVEDNVIADFLINDPTMIDKIFTRKMLAEIELKKNGYSRDLKEVFEDLARENREKIEDLELLAQKENWTPEKLLEAEKDLRKEYERMVEHFEWTRDQLHHRNRTPDSMLVRGTDRLRKFVGMPMLGMSAVPNSIGDIASLGTALGQSRLYKVMLQYFLNSDFRKMIKKEGLKIGTLSDQINAMMRSRESDPDLFDGFAPVEARIDRGLNVASETFAKVAGITKWAEFTRAWGTASAQDELLGFIEKGYTTLSKTQKKMLARFYIDEDMANRIQKELTNMSKDGGVRFANTEKWTDTIAAQTFEMAVNARLDHVLNIPTIATKSHKMTDSVPMKMFMTFKSFNQSAYDNLLMSRVIQGDASVPDIATGIAAMFFWGTASSLAYDTMTGRDSDWVKNPYKVAWRALDKSGVVAVPFDNFQIALKATTSQQDIGKGWKNLVAQLPDGDLKDAVTDIMVPRYQERGSGPASALANAIGGAGLGYAANVAEIANEAISMAAGKDRQEQLIHKIRTSLPGQNIFWLRRGLDYFESEIGGRDFNYNQNRK